MMLSLGLFVFEIGTLPYQELSRRLDWRHARSERVGAAEASQFLGAGRDEITLAGILLPAIAGSYSSLDTIMAMAAQGEAWPLLDGSGRVLGTFAISALDTRAGDFFEDGAARRTDFTLNLFAVEP